MARATRLLLLGLPVAALLVGLAQVVKPLRVGDVTPEGTLVPTGRFMAPKGVTANLGEAVVDALLTPDQAEAVIKDSSGVAVVSVAKGKLLSSAALEGGASLTGVALSPDGTTVACSTAGSTVELFSLNRGQIAHSDTVPLPQAAAGGACYPCGLAFLDGGHLAVALNRDNSLAIVDLASKTISKKIPVDIAPYGVLVEDPTHLLVDCWAAPNALGRPSAPSAGTEVEVDKRGIATTASICRVDLKAGTVAQRAEIPSLQPTDMARDVDTVYVACANGDGVELLDAATLKPERTLRVGRLSGSAPDSLALDPTSHRLYVAFAGLDRVGAYDLATERWIGFSRTAWYPSVVRVVPKGLIIATAKGLGSRSGAGPKRGVYDLTSTVSYVQNPSFGDSLPSEALDGPARTTAQPVPVPARTGEPSVFRHVVYVIKENRTYDQLLGDMKEGNGDPDLTMYGESVTPNHHAIARQFVLLDNYYCNGIVSADGHAWATEANATSYYEHTRGGWTRSYPFGDDPLATSVSGYLWDDALDHGHTVQNFGEFDYASPDPAMGAIDLLHAFQAGKPLHFKQNIGVERLRKLSDRDYPGWNLAIPDTLRASRFVQALNQMEKRGRMADLTIVYLPQDHTAGGSAGFPSPRAQVADNDLGLGQVIEAISHSRFWSNTVVFAEEDDPQDGFDHVDGHRSLFLIASPYTRRDTVVSEFYNQASAIHTIERILGIPPMNVNDAEAPVMTDCFQANADMRPYAAVPNQIPLDETPPKHTAVRFNLTKPDDVDDDKFNHQLWAMSGKSGPYPAVMAGDRHRTDHDPSP